MLVERPGFLLRPLTPGALFRGRRHDEEGHPLVYLTFDDGPDPEITPFVLEELARHDMKATFFMVGDNAARNPGLVNEIIRLGHRVGNHTMHHLQGLHTSVADYLDDIRQAERHIPSRLFRPPHGWLPPSHRRRLLALGWKIVMFDLVTRDYSNRLTPRDVVGNVKRYVRPGSVIVFHDSRKAWPRLKEALPACLDLLTEKGYRVKPLEI